MPVPCCPRWSRHMVRHSFGEMNMNAFKKPLVAIAALATLGATGLASTQASANGYGYGYGSGCGGVGKKYFFCSAIHLSVSRPISRLPLDRYLRSATKPQPNLRR